MVFVVFAYIFTLFAHDLFFISCMRSFSKFICFAINMGWNFSLFALGFVFFQPWTKLFSICTHSTALTINTYFQLIETNNQLLSHTKINPIDCNYLKNSTTILFFMSISNIRITTFSLCKVVISLNIFRLIIFWEMEFMKTFSVLNGKECIITLEK